MSSIKPIDPIDFRNSVIKASEGACAIQITGGNINQNYFASKAENLSRSVGDNRVKEPYQSCDYRHYRRNETAPEGPREIMEYGDDAYYKVGIIRNIVDLMSDFTTKGMAWVHHDRNVEAFYNSWFKTVEGLDVSERLCSYLVRMGNAVIFPMESKIRPELASEWKKTRGSEFSGIDYKAGHIPSSYNFIHPCSLTQISGDFGNFLSTRIFQMTVPPTVLSLMKNYNDNRAGMNESIKSMIHGIPSNLREQMLKNNGQLQLTEEDLIVSHYRKDDWRQWAEPMISCIFPQLIMLEKMHLADMSALDGAISNIRLWRVGYIDPSNINNSFIPTPEMLQQVRNLLHTNVSGGVLDLVWGPEIDFKESSTQVHNFLGPDKYSQVMREIYDGLGVPPSLSGSSGDGGTGFTNNFISMKVLVDRLTYLKNKLKDFWDTEAKKVQLAMGFSSPAKLQFADAIMSNEDQHKKLIIELWDRDIIDTETVRKEFNMYDKIVQSRLMKEIRRRENNKGPKKAGPYHRPQLEDVLKHKLIEQGRVEDENLPFDVEDLPEETLAPKNPEGRPSGTTDMSKRKTKVVNPRTTAFVTVQNWARESYDTLTELIKPTFLKTVGKKTVRELNTEQQITMENFILTVMGNYEPMSNISADNIASVTSNLKGQGTLLAMRDTLLLDMQTKYSRPVVIEDKRVAACAAYSLLYS